MLALWAIVFLGERPSAPGYIGIAAILAGLVVLGAAPLWTGRHRGPDLRATLRTHARGSGIAFLVAFLISVYSAVDGAAVRHWTPIPYLVLTFGISGLVLIPLLALREGTRVFRVVRTHTVPIALIAVMMLGAYSLVLRAFQIAPISYAGAGREIGIVFGAMAGWLVLGERFGGVRTAGAALVFVGILVLAVAG
ncbi:MAG: EamA family transporter [Gemmatimonadetes bacterium]|nr:EamA family transporter [Gemmatimonadota bacterium]